MCSRISSWVTNPSSTSSSPDRLASGHNKCHQIRDRIDSLNCMTKPIRVVAQVDDHRKYSGFHAHGTVYPLRLRPFQTGLTTKSCMPSIRIHVQTSIFCHLRKINKHLIAGDDLIRISHHSLYSINKLLREPSVFSLGPPLRRSPTLQHAN